MKNETITIFGHVDTEKNTYFALRDVDNEPLGIIKKYKGMYVYIPEDAMFVTHKEISKINSLLNNLNNRNICPCCGQYSKDGKICEECL